MYRMAAITAAVGAIAFGSMAAAATGVLTGSFAGTAVNSELYFGPQGMPVSFDGTPISGTFRIDDSHCATITIGPLAGTCVQFGSTLTINYAYGSATFGIPTNLTQVVDTAASQTLNITFSFTDPYNAAYLSLAGGPNAFVDGMDYANLHPGAFDLSTASLVLHGGREFRATVALTSLGFDRVSEPAGWMPLVAGLGIAGVGLARRKQHGRPAA